MNYKECYQVLAKYNFVLDDESSRNSRFIIWKDPINYRKAEILITTYQPITAICYICFGDYRSNKIENSIELHKELQPPPPTLKIR